MSLSSDESSIDLALSCSFSDAESSASEPDGSLESVSNAVVEPYMYEPLASDSEAGGVDDMNPKTVDVFSTRTGKDLGLLLKLWMIF